MNECMNVMIHPFGTSGRHPASCSCLFLLKWSLDQVLDITNSFKCMTWAMHFFHESWASHPHVHRNPDELKDTPERDLTCKMGDLNRHSGQKYWAFTKTPYSLYILIAVFLDGYCVQQLHMHKSNHFQIGQKLRNLRSPRKNATTNEADFYVRIHWK